MASAVAAIRLLLLTGCRKNEILMLRWDDIDRTAGELRLRDTKSGPRRVPLTPAAERVLARNTARRKAIPGSSPAGSRVRPSPNGSIRSGTGCGRAPAWTDVRLHDCRHSFASQALALGEGLPTIARLLGHKTVMTTVTSTRTWRGTPKGRRRRKSGTASATISCPLNVDGR